jgi:hypothetical protein
VTDVESIAAGKEVVSGEGVEEVEGDVPLSFRGSPSLSESGGLPQEKSDNNRGV